MIEEQRFLEKLKTEWGISIVEVGNDFLTTEMTMEKPSFFNIHGIVYGGVLYQLADVTAGIAARVLGTKSVTAQGNIAYYTTLTGGKAFCRCTLEKQGSRLSFLKSTITDERGTKIAEAQFVFCSYDKSKE